MINTSEVRVNVVVDAPHGEAGLKALRDGVCRRDGVSNAMRRRVGRFPCGHSTGYQRRRRSPISNAGTVAIAAAEGSGNTSVSTLSIVSDPPPTTANWGFPARPPPLRAMSKNAAPPPSCVTV